MEMGDATENFKEEIICEPRPDCFASILPLSVTETGEDHREWDLQATWLCYKICRFNVDVYIGILSAP